MDTGTVLLVVIGVLLLVVLLLLFGGGMAMGGMAMMAGTMSSPVGIVVFLILAALIAWIGYVLLFAP